MNSSTWLQSPGHSEIIWVGTAVILSGLPKCTQGSKVTFNFHFWYGRMASSGRSHTPCVSICYGSDNIPKVIVIWRRNSLIPHLKSPGGAESRRASCQRGLIDVLCAGLVPGQRASVPFLWLLLRSQHPRAAGRPGRAKLKERAKQGLTRETSGRVFVVPWTVSPVSSRSRVF